MFSVSGDVSGRADGATGVLVVSVSAEWAWIHRCTQNGPSRWARGGRGRPLASDECAERNAGRVCWRGAAGEGGGVDEWDGLRGRLVRESW